METLPRLLNELQDPNKMKRCAAFKNLNKLVSSNGGAVEPDDCFNIIRSCLRAFEDTSERCREEAVMITTQLIEQRDASILDWVLPSIVTRIGVEPVAEESEEIRLRLLRLAVKCMTLFPNDIGPRNYIDFFQVLLENCFRDAFPDLKKEACKATALLCSIEPQQVKTISVPLANAIKGACLLHKHGAVRCEAARTLGILFRHGASEVLMEGKEEPESRTTASQLYVLCNDHSEPVRLAVVDVLACALLDVKARLEHHSRYLPHLLFLTTDSFENVRNEALGVLEKLGKLYILDNEDNRADLSSRRVTMKDIEWYADDEYPDMSLTCDKKDAYPLLAQRPSLGSRYVVAEATRGYLEKVLADITAIDWVIPYSTNNRRVVALRILWNTIFHCEKSAVQFTERILGTIYKALRDESDDLRQEAILCTEILGKFLTPDQYLPFLVAKPSGSATAKNEEESTQIEKTRNKTIILASAETTEPEKNPTLFSTAAISTKCSILTTLSYLLEGSQASLTAKHATQITQTLTSTELTECEHEELLLSLLGTLRTVVSIFSRRAFISSPANPLPADIRDDPRQRTLDSILFYALLRLQSADFPSVRAAAAKGISSLSAMVTGTPDGIYGLHASRILTRYSGGIPVDAFSDLLLRSHTTCPLGDLIKDIFVSKLSDVNFTVRVTDELKYFTVLERLLWSKTPMFSPEALEELVRLVIVPLGSFQPGNAAHLFRKVAVNCLCALSNPFYQASLEETLSNHGGALATKLITLWCSASDSDDGEMRLVCMTALPDICNLFMTNGSANEAIQSIILRFDDSSDAIRYHTATGLLTVLKSLSNEEGDSTVVLKQEVSQQMVPLAKKVLIYMDDQQETTGIRTVLVDVLKCLGDISPHIVLDLARNAVTKHQNPTYCQAVLTYLEGRHSS